MTKWTPSYDGDFNGTNGLKQSIQQKTLSDVPNAIMRPLYENNMAKVPHVKFSQN